MSNWRELMPLPPCKGTCDWQVTDKVALRCGTCGLSDARGTRFWRVLLARVRPRTR